MKTEVPSRSQSYRRIGVPLLRVLTALALGSLLAVAGASTADAPKPPSVFDLPMMTATQQEVTRLFARGDYEKAAALLKNAVKRTPLDIIAQYNLACALARQGKTDDSLAHLEKSVELGFADAEHLEDDDDLADLRQLPRFQAAVKKARENALANGHGRKDAVEPAKYKDGQYLVGETNTVYDPRLGLFAAVFRIDKAATAGKPVVEGYGKAGERLKRWYKEGTAAGNHGDLYDNRDGGHSFMDFNWFPQLARVIYCEAARERHLNWGLQRPFLYNGVCIGNSSTALTGGPAWRCQGRLALTERGVPTVLYLQYVGHHLYVYPVHADNNPGHNGAGGKGYGDVVPANTPYLLLSQGSSGSDVVFLDALVATLAALRPEVKRDLAASGTLMPALQMVLRMSNRQVAKTEDYLTGKAHPTAFDGSQLDAVKMVTLAHGITPETLPPMIQLKVLEENLGVVGRDYFDVGPRERLFDTPCAVARIVKSSQYEHRMLLSAEGSKDLNHRPLTYHWAVLRGDESRIRIRKLNAEGSQVELIVPYHERRPIAPGNERESNRVDIGAFVHNGVYYSAPAFISLYTLDNEKRVYDEKHGMRIRSVDYNDPAVRDNYVDPLLDFRKDWRDEYHYAGDGSLSGWTRIRGQGREEFTADGRLVLEKAKDGKPAKTAQVRYRGKLVPNGTPVLEQVTE
jgi:hypothetical protein